MTTTLAIDITPDPDGVRCGECKCLSLGNSPVACFVPNEEADGYIRGPLCLAAEQRHKRMVEALREVIQALDISLEQIESGDRNFEEALDLIADSVLVARRAILREEEG